MTKFAVHRCRLFDYTPCAIHCLATCQATGELAVARSDGSVEVWNPGIAWFTKMVIPGSKVRSVESLLWLGKRLISGGIHGDITEYDLTTASVKTSIDSFGDSVWCLSLSPNEDKLAAGCEDGSVKTFDVQNKSIMYERSFDKQEGRILSMSWHCDGDVIVTGGIDVIRIWSNKTGRAIHRITIDREMSKVEAIVWSLHIQKDFTIISGDSCGRVQFWNAKDGTQLQSYHTHRADVLCICPAPDQRSVYAAGVDPKVIQFNLVNLDDPTSWVKGRSLQKHTHDVRALAVVGNCIVSGGVDTNLLVNSLKQNVNDFQRVHAYPSKPLVSYSPAKQLLLFQYPEQLDLWTLAKTAGDENENCQIDEEPVWLVGVKKPKSDVNHIVCSSMSPSGEWIAYSTMSSFRLYHLTFDEEDLKVDLQRVHCVGHAPAHTIVFTPDSSHVIISATNHKVLIVKLDVETRGARLIQVIPIQSHTCASHLLAVSPNSKYLAVSNLDSEISVYHLDDMTLVCSLPRYCHPPTAMSFDAKNNNLMISYADLEVYEYSLKEQSYTPWTKDVHSRVDEPVLSRLLDHSSLHTKPGVVYKILFIDSEDKEEVHFVARNGIYVLAKNSASGKKRLEGRYCHRFKPVLYCDVIDQGTMLIVERPLEDIYDQLPPTLYQKKFGT